MEFIVVVAVEVVGVAADSVCGSAVVVAVAEVAEVAVVVVIVVVVVVVVKGCGNH